MHWKSNIRVHVYLRWRKNPKIIKHGFWTRVPAASFAWGAQSWIDNKAMHHALHKQIPKTKARVQYICYWRMHLMSHLRSKGNISNSLVGGRTYHARYWTAVSHPPQLSTMSFETLLRDGIWVMPMKSIKFSDMTCVVPYTVTMRWFWHFTTAGSNVKHNASLDPSKGSTTCCSIQCSSVWILLWIRCYFCWISKVKWPFRHKRWMIEK